MNRIDIEAVVIRVSRTDPVAAVVAPRFVHHPGYCVHAERETLVGAELSPSAPDQLFPKMSYAARMRAPTSVELSGPIAFSGVRWGDVPDTPGVYVIADQQEIVYVGMAVACGTTPPAKS